MCMGRLSRSSTTKVSSKTLSPSTSQTRSGWPGLCTFVTDSPPGLQSGHGSAVMPTFRGVKPCKTSLFGRRIRSKMADSGIRMRPVPSSGAGQGVTPRPGDHRLQHHRRVREQGRPASTHRHLPGVDQDLAGVSHRGQLLPKVGQHDDVVASIAQHPWREGLQQGQ